MDKRTKVLFITDSLGLPRPDGEVVASDSWPQIVGRNLSNKFEFYYQLHGGLHTKQMMLIREQGYLGGYDPDIVFLQIGVVDCSSRVLKEKEKQIISMIPIVRTIIRKFVKRFHKKLSIMRNITYVNRENFKKNLIRLQKSFPDKKIYALPIAPATKGFVEMMPRVEKNISDYNMIIEEVFGSTFQGSLYSDEEIESVLLSDHYHLNNKGHQMVASKVITILDSI
jgi:lysophospholipase L1-like esterase